jgi:DNA polymerase III delta subunit
MMQLASTDAAIKGAEKDPVFALEKLVLNISGKGTN